MAQAEGGISANAHGAAEEDSEQSNIFPQLSKNPARFEWENDVFIKLGALFQVRGMMAYNEVEPSTSDSELDENSVIGGISIPRARIFLDGGLAPWLRFRFRLGTFNRSSLRVEQVFVDILPASGWRIRAGQFFLPILAEQEANPNDLLFNDYSMMGAQFGPGNVLGVSVRHRSNIWEIQGAGSNGLRSAYTELGDPLQADIAVSTRIAFKSEGMDWGAFENRIPNWGGGSGYRLAINGHYQHGGSTGSTTPHELVYSTFDATFRSSRFFSMLTLAFSDQNTEGTGWVPSLGFEMEMGYRFHKDWHAGIRYDSIIQRATYDENGDLQTFAQAWFAGMGVTVARHLLVGFITSKIAVDVLYYPRGNSGSSIGANPGAGLAYDSVTEGGAARLQMDFAF